jgi:hypothetical protein
VLGPPPLPPQQWHLVEETATFIPSPPPVQSVNCLFHVRKDNVFLKKQNVLKIRKMYSKYEKCIKNAKNVLKM